jgi:hypothetical protein
MLFLLFLFLKCGSFSETRINFQKSLLIKPPKTTSLSQNLTTPIVLSDLLKFLKPLQSRYRSSSFSTFSYFHGLDPLEINLNVAYYGGVYDPGCHRIYLVPSRQTFSSSLQTHWHYIDCFTQRVKSYEHGLDFSDFNPDAYVGGVYDPMNHRIYFIPYAQADPSSFQSRWHYIDCSSGQVQSYAHNRPSSEFQTRAYVGGVYDPIQGRIYFVPYQQIRSTNFKTHWHYIDCQTNTVQTYAHGFLETDFQSNAYVGAVFSPTQKKIYFIPIRQTLTNNFKTHWHYIDCETGLVNSYPHGRPASEFVDASSYAGGVFVPTLNRIYFVPFEQSNAKEYWHYIDCSNGLVVAYEHEVSLAHLNENAYAGGVYDPLLNRVYFVPRGQTSENEFKEVWHYLDCELEAIQEYEHGFSSSAFVNNAYNGGIFVPQSNQIYFLSYFQSASRPYWHGIQNFAQPVLARQDLMHNIFQSF